ncbi:hypothetical protein [Myxococcus sp. RHSTA-1-4]|uniref:hypothetical protein n=1 Tax=Myxococcus sp. RHSTA-1-4 TaxID=2874601 RepID=UPI001CC00B51|nr:hypothetical protein [Myxococcus sp. RHSTA-1-4]MBZ4415613.1 hypothetical protein [Myxococcus sp. RHSTA-1-4]
MKRILLSAALAASSLAPLACDLEKAGNQLAAEHVMVGTLLSTPQVDVSASALAGYDAGTFGGPDGGADVISLPAQTAAVVFFGTRSGENSQPSGVAGATVTLQPLSGQATSLTEDGSGSYSRTSVGDEELVYQSGATYQFIAAQGGTRYVGQVDDAPVKEAITAFHPPEGFLRIDARTALTFDRVAVPDGQDRTLGFVTVVPLSADGEKGEPTYSNMPQTPIQFLQLVGLPGPYREARVTIPGEAFPQSNQTYLIIFQAVRMGGAESDNLFLGSALLAGTAEVGVVRTR